MIGEPALPRLQQCHLGRPWVGAVFQSGRDVQRAHDALGQFGVESLPGLDGVEHDVETGVDRLPEMIGPKTADAPFTCHYELHVIVCQRRFISSVRFWGY